MDLPNPSAYGILVQRGMKCMMKFQNLSDLLDALDSPDALPKLPEPIRKELERIQKLEGEPYGLVFAVRDLYETVLKVICLSVCVLIDRNGDLLAYFARLAMIGMIVVLVALFVYTRIRRKQ